jgi:hypothetical protein
MDRRLKRTSRIDIRSHRAVSIAIAPKWLAGYESFGSSANMGLHCFDLATPVIGKRTHYSSDLGAAMDNRLQRCLYCDI